MSVDISSLNLSILPHVNISFLDKDGNLPQRSGLNWGQRPEYNREPNQAYIRIPQNISQTSFFPIRGRNFNLFTDDEQYFSCVIAQDNSKAIHTPDNNSQFGIYFRNRIGVQIDFPVSTKDLIHYGRTDIDIYKIDALNYYMDFSV
jgi:hypothetical protein